ncbi:hypothetical protein NRB_46810 [Novosphingobium sp. 11B]
MARNKTDPIDADGLAHLAEAAFYKEVRAKGYDSMLVRTRVAGLSPECWPASRRNPRPASSGIRSQAPQDRARIGLPAARRLITECAATLSLIEGHRLPRLSRRPLDYREEIRVEFFAPADRAWLARPIIGAPFTMLNHDHGASALTKPKHSTGSPASLNEHAADGRGRGGSSVLLGTICSPADVHRRPRKG